MAEIEFQDVAPYRCPGCEHRVTVSPCPACIALRRGGPAAVVADVLLSAAGRRAQRASDRAGREAAAVP